MGRPFAGAWIETRQALAIQLPDLGLSPLRGGVDRNAPGQAVQSQNYSRPFAGAWIETERRQGDAE